MAASAEKSTDDLKAEIADLKADVSRLADTIKGMSSDTAAKGRDRVEHAAKRSRERVEDTLGTVESEIGERPLTSIAAAFGVGFVIGKLFDR